MHLTLEQWQQTLKPRSELLYNCSEYQFLNDQWVPFPVGMGYSFLSHAENLAKAQIGNHESLVLCAISDHTDSRRRPSGINRRAILSTLSRNGIPNHKFCSGDYFRCLPQYKFVISPEGNGIDCHRHYEALMAGCIPIVEEHEGIREKYRGCPILFTKDYSEITHAYLEEQYKSFLTQEWDFSRLLFSSYDENTKKEICDNGNYWCSRLLGRKWY